MQYLPLDVYSLNISEYLTSPFDDFNYKVVLRRGTDIPRKLLIPKDKQRTKFRAVYNYSKETKGFFKVLYNYFSKHYTFNGNTFAYRKGVSISTPINKVLQYKNQGYYLLKVDISKYFNSVSYKYLSEVILPTLFTDGKSLDLMRKIFSNRKCYSEGVIVQEDMGIQPGNPFSSFLANYVLDLLDRFMLTQVKGYIRYSDDILIAGSSEEELQTFLNILVNKLSEIGLTVNPNKVEITSPQEPTAFLGTIIFNGVKQPTKNKKMAFKKIVKHYVKKYLGKDYRNLPFEQKVSMCFTETVNALFGGLIHSDRCSGIGGFIATNCTSPKDDEELNDYLIQEFKVLKTGKHNKATWAKTSLKELTLYGFIDWFTMKSFYNNNKYFFAEKIYKMHRDFVLAQSIKYNGNKMFPHLMNQSPSLKDSQKSLYKYTQRVLVKTPSQLFSVLNTLVKTNSITNQIECNPLKGQLIINGIVILDNFVVINHYLELYTVNDIHQYIKVVVKLDFNELCENSLRLDYECLFKLYQGYCLQKGKKSLLQYKSIRSTIDCTSIDSNLSDSYRILSFNLYLLFTLKALKDLSKKYTVVRNPNDTNQYFILM